MTTIQQRLLPRKYLPIVYAVAFFLVFDLGVLVLNFYTSYQISEDAVAINLAGRQRMLSQRMTKSILTLNEDLRAGMDASGTFKELQTTVGLFEGTLKAFEKGGQATGSDGKPTSLQAVESEQGREILSQAQKIWDPYREALQPLLKGDLTLDTAAVIGVLPAAMAVARENNLKLLDLMNRLTTHLEQFAKQKADRLRLVQTVGITLALINFGFILFHFLRQLRDGDQRIEAARRETTEILDTVNEGLFLLGANGRIGNQFSASLPRVLHRAVEPGEDFFALLKNMAPESTVQVATRYIELLFSDRVRERLVDDLNPLSRFEIQIDNPSGGRESRYLDMQFNRAIVEGRISHLLVTVTDITERVRLEQELASAGRLAKTESEMLVSILHIEPAELLEFLDSTEKTLLEINEHLKHKSAGPVDCLRTVQSVFRSIHSVKGEAAALGLESIELLAHQFEQVLAVLRERERLSGDDLLSLPIHLKELFERLDLIRGVMQRASGLQRALTDAGTGSAPDGLTVEIQGLAARVAETQRKQVRVAAEMAGFDGLPETTRRALKDMAFQLIRNAVYHGIETPEERTRADKPQEGTIRITLRPVGAGRFEFVVRDDGRGLVPERIREALLASGRHRLEDVNALDERTLLSKIFEPGFSTAGQNADRDAGHGVGLDLVKTKLLALHAHLRLDTKPGQFTEFRIQFAA